MLKLDGIKKLFAGPTGPVPALKECFLTIKPGEFTAIKGPSGCGKSTLLLSAGGLLRPDAGKVLVSDQDIYELKADARSRFRAANIGFVFQQFHLIPYLSVLDNVLAPSLAHPVADAEERAKELLFHFGLTDRLDHVPGALSTGEKQRVALARALLNRPKVLLADEPTGNLDEQNGKNVLGILADYAVTGGAVLLVTHDPKAAGFAHRILEMKEGLLNQ